MKRLQDQVVIITGVASGIGRASTYLFIQEGALVFGVDRDPKGIQSLSDDLAGYPSQFHGFEADLALPESAVKIVEACQNLWGKVDVLFNCAGISILQPFLEVTPDTLSKIMAVNFSAPFYLCQAVLSPMLQQGHGTIINVASELAIVAQPLYSAYCASKGAVLSFTRALALEYAQHNIRINAICPGPVDTPMLQQEFNLESDPLASKQSAIASMPIGRLGKPEEIAKVALFLATDAPALIHGSALVVDGAKTII